VRYKNFLTTASLLVFGFSLGACTTDGAKKNGLTLMEEGFSERRKVYGLLRKEVGMYRFTEFSFFPVNLDVEPWILLNSYQPVFDQNEIVCSKAIRDLVMPKKPERRCDIEVEFRKNDISIGTNLVTNTIGAAMTMGLTLGGYYTKVFDKNAFDKALTEASSNFDRRQFFQDLKAYELKVDGVFLNQKNAIEEKKKKLRSLIKVVEIDRSGIFKGSVGDDSVDLISNTPVKIDIQDTWANFFKLNDFLDHASLEGSQKIKVRLLCKPVSGWRSEIQGCDISSSLSDSDSDSVYVKYTILSQDSRNLILPILAQDDAVKISLSKDGQALMIENKSKSYINVKSASLYLEKDVSTFKDANVELAPLTEARVLAMNNFPAFEKVRLRNVVKRDIDRKALVGIAIKYTVVDTNKDKTLFRTDTVNFFDLDYVSR